MNILDIRRAGLALIAALVFANPAWGAEIEDPLYSHLRIDRLEQRWSDGGNALEWEAQAWFGGDENKLWLKSSGGRRSGGGLESAEGQVLYSRMIAPFWDAQAGLRYDVEPGPGRAFATVGVSGLAPYFFELNAAAFLDQDGGLSARLGAEYDLLITQRVVLQPSLELNAAATGASRHGLGSGLNDIELGLRARYEIRREFAPYVGVSWQRKLGRTADLARGESEDVDNLALFTGLRFWF